MPLRLIPLSQPLTHSEAAVVAMDQEGLATAQAVGRLLSHLCETDFVGMQNE